MTLKVSIGERVGFRSCGDHSPEPAGGCGCIDTQVDDKEARWSKEDKDKLAQEMITEFGI